MKLVLENGKIFNINTNIEKEEVTEIIYNTQVVGYQEIISNPFYLNKIVVMTYPIIGNYGLNDEDFESKNLTIKGLIASEINDEPSNFRYTRTLKEYLEENNAYIISDLDTRALTRELRKNNITKCMIANDSRNINDCLDLINKYEVSNNIYDKVSVKKISYSRTKNPILNIGILDLGVNKSLINNLNTLGCNVVLIPYNYNLDVLNKLNLNGVIISSGPEYLDKLNIDLKSLIDNYKIYALGVGALLIARYLGLEIIKLDNIHVGSNHPIKNILSNKIDFYQQNHTLTIKENENIEVIYKNVLDNSIEGFKYKNITCTLFNPNFDEKNLIIKEFINSCKGE